MNFQQLRTIRETVRRGFNLTEVAQALFTSQPGVSRQILELEGELGVDIFERSGKRLTGLTEPGKSILQIAERLLLEAENLKQVGREFAESTIGTLTIATTHNQARHVLPEVVSQFREAYPDVRIALKQGGPDTITDWVLSGHADFGIATEGLSETESMASFPCYTWQHVVVVPKSHPLLEIPDATLADLARYPLVTYDNGLTGRSHIDDAFRKAGLETDIVLTAMDSDVIQQYVALGLGVGIVASMAVEHNLNSQLAVLPAAGLFEKNVTRIAVRRGTYLRNYKLDFMLRMAPQLDRETLLSAI